ncbi:MAG TPA: protein kinase, partial [Stenomitos sp.]
MGQQLGNYEIEHELGRGGMGVVYKATDLKLGRVVAIKELLVSNAMPEVERQDTVERFRREAMAAARMAHPNIVTVYDYGQDGDRHYMAMELLTGKSLGDYLEKKTKFTIQQVVDISVQICAALDYAHQAGVVHRDIKPDNIMLAENGKVKLTDFGVARVKSDLPSMTTTGTTLGTIAYMSPEQLTDSRLVDGRADLFSLGALIYEMLTFRTPFDAGNLGGTIINIMSSPPPPPREINQDIPAKLEAVILRALKKNPEERYSRAAEMGHALQAALREPERPAAPKIVDPATRPVGEPEPCRHCGADLPPSSRVCPSCGRASNAPLTYSLPTMPSRNAAPQPAAPSPMGPPKMPPPSGNQMAAARGSIPVMPTPNRAPGTAPLNAPAAAAAPMQSMAPPPVAPAQPPMGIPQPHGTGALGSPAERRMPVPPDRTGPQIQLKVAGLKAVSSIGRPGVGQGEFQQPRCVLLDSAKNLLVADTENGRIQVFDASGHFMRMIRAPQTQDSFRFPRALAINPLNIIYVTDDLDFRIYKFDAMGRQLAVWKRMRTL